MRITKNDEIKCLKIQVKNLEEQLEIQKRRFDEYRMSEPEAFKKDTFYDKPYSEMYSQFIQLGMEKLEEKRQA